MLIFQDVEIHGIAEDMSDDEFIAFCAANCDLRIERTADKTIIVMPPASGEFGFYEGEVCGELHNWNKSQQNGITFSPSTGFYLPNGAIRACDASWITWERWKTLDKVNKSYFLPFAPDFTIEFHSEMDNFKKLKAKMLEWIENGIRLAWLIDPMEQKTYIYRADGSIEILEGFERELSGENVLKGFVFDLRLLRLP